jgi:hypothetical protein
MKPRKGSFKKGEAVLVRLGTAEVKATVVRDESAGRPVILRTESGQLMTAFPDSLVRAAG